MGKLILIFVLTVALILGWIGWNMREEQSVPKKAATETNEIRIVATFYPLQQFARAVVGDEGKVEAVVPAGTEPHDYEPSAQDIKSIYQADLFLLNGAGIDPWAEKIMSEFEKKGVPTIRLADLVELLSEGEGAHAHAEATGKTGTQPKLAIEGGEEQGEWDPHFWIDPLLAEKAITAITATLSTRFPEKKTVFESNRNQFVAELHKLDMAYTTGLTSCKLNEIVTTHNSFGYLAHRYGFETHSLTGLSPENEPSPRRLAELSDEIKKEGIRYILFETLVSPKIAETLAQSAGVETLIFNPIEGVTEEEAAEGKNYLSLMHDNLSTLRKALECK